MNTMEIFNRKGRKHRISCPNNDQKEYRSKLSRMAISGITMLFFFLVLGFSFLNTSEDPFVTDLKGKLQRFFKAKPWEKVYVHVDKSLYKPGEDVWLKAYLTNGSTNKPSRTSDVLYIELINPKGNVEKTLNLQAIQGICFGNFTIDESAVGGIYKIKAYTSWMKNYGEDYFFEKEIQVQKVVYPRLLSKFKFKKESYSPGDTVNLDLTFETLENLPKAFQQVTIDISYDGKINKSLDVTADNKGKASVSFLLPVGLTTNDGLVNAKIRHEGNMEAISRSIPIVLNKIDLQFFPEGGYMVTNVRANVAFKALNELGKPAEIAGYITDENDAVVTKFESFHQGMGAFGLTPLPGKRYTAHVTKPKTDQLFRLPDAMPKGYTMRTVLEGKNKYKIEYYSPISERVHIIVQAGSTICFNETQVARVGLNYVTFSADKFPAGTGIITLFDHNGTPRCERLAYFNYQKRLTISLSFDKEKYAPREKVSLRIRTLDSDSIPTPANLSLAVVNDQLYTLADDKQHNIVSWLMFGSEIKGKVEKPSYYFDPEEPDAGKALDYLLLTQGWRRYTWDDVQHMNCNISVMPEKIGCIAGTVTDKITGQPVKAEVTLIELQNRQRILKVNTGTNGKFKFLDADAASTLQLLARADGVSPNNLVVELNQLNEIPENGYNNAGRTGKELLPEIIKIKAGEVIEKQQKGGDKGRLVAVAEGVVQGNAGNDVVLDENVARLEEVVVVGYGVQKKVDLTASVVEVKAADIRNVSPLNVQQALQGRAAGIEVINENGQPGIAPQIRIRGMQTLSNNQNPLYVVDGVEYDPSLSGNTSPLNSIPMSNIESITVLKDAGSTAIYGCRGANGVIIITTNSNRGYYKSVKKPFNPKYTGLIISPRQMSFSKEFYYPVYKDKEMPEVREDFRPTIYWNPNINTNNAGEATVEFYTSDEITSFRAVVEGIGREGNVGRTEKKIFSQLPFSMAVKFPAYLTFNDTVAMPLIIKNNTNADIDGKILFDVPQSLQPLGDLPVNLMVKANETLSLSIPCVVLNRAGKDTLTVSFRGGKFKDAFIQPVEVQPKGFPTRFTASGKELEKSFRFVVNKAVGGSVKAEFNAFPDMLTDLMSGVESILREPYGCFEQTSSSTYPNIMVLQYLNETGSSDPGVSKRAKDLISKGYNRLISFETKENGYEWFGGFPAHEGLTAYGIMEFTDMRGVYAGVDNAMMKRTLDWILSQRDGKGGFKRSTEALDQFGRASNEVTNAYIVYALSEAGIDEIDQEYKLALNEALKSRDPYRLALMANAAYNFKRPKDAAELMQQLQSKLGDKTWDQIGIDHSITRSYGRSLQVETASLYTLALIKAPVTDWIALQKNVNYLVSSRQYGSFGSTQATILALKALKNYANLSKQTAESGTISISINGTIAVNYSYPKGEKGKIHFEGLEKYLKEGENQVTIQFSNTKNALPFSFDAGWNSMTPASDSNCKVRLNTSLSASQTKVGETVRLSVKLQNITSDGLPMTIAIVGIPSGLSLQPWQLKEIQDKQQVDFYEISRNYLVAYYRQMAPGEQRQLNLDLKADIPGNYNAPASAAYLYYTNEFKDWKDGEYISIKK